jgi:hypothetical protein
MMLPLLFTKKISPTAPEVPTVYVDEPLRTTVSVKLSPLARLELPKGPPPSVVCTSPRRTELEGLAVPEPVCSYT